MKSTTDTAANTTDGLCSTCAHRSGCCFLRPGEGSRTQCEEFDPGVPAPARPRLRALPDAPQSAPAEETGRELLGLCQNCRLRDTCRYPRPEGGVWDCEDYE